MTDFTWPGDRKLAVSVVVNVEEGAEQNIRDGDRGPEPVDELLVSLNKPIRIHVNETNYQYGVNEGFPRVLDLLEQYQIPATWTSAALALERAPQIAKAIVSRNDDVCCHGYRWVHQYWMDEEKERDFIRKGRQSIEGTCGKPPSGWLSRYMHTDVTRKILAEEGFLYHMDDFSRDTPFWDMVETSSGVKPMIIVPYALDTNDMKFWLTPALSVSDWLDYAINSFDWLYRESQTKGARMMSVGLHLRIIGRPGRIWALEKLFNHINGKGDVWIATREQIAKAYSDQVSPPQ